MTNDELTVIYTLLDVCEPEAFRPNTSTPAVRKREAEAKFERSRLLQSIDFDVPQSPSVNLPARRVEPPVESRACVTLETNLPVRKGETPVESRTKEKPEVIVLGYRRAPMKPGKFDGTGSLESFLVQFEVCARHNGWTNVDRADFLRCALEKAATQLLWDFGARQDITYDELVGRLRERYGTAGQA